MKKIIFVRHGKAEIQRPELNDFERSLTSKGKVVSKQMAKRFHEREKSPGLLISSPAFRAIETALIFAEEFGTDAQKIILDSNVYDALDMKYLIRLLAGISEETAAITLFGHNPSFTDVADELSREGCDMLPKSGIVCISFNVGIWSDVKTSNGKVEYFLKP